MADSGLRAVRDGELLGGGAVLAERALHSSLIRSQVSGSPSSVSVPFARDAPRSISTPTAIPASTARQARRMPSSSCSVFTRRRSSKKRWSAVELDALPAEVVRIGEREAGGRHGLLEPERLAGDHVQLQRVRIGVEAALEQLVHADVLEREHLEVRSEIADPAGLERADDDASRPADLRVEEGVGDGERHLVPQLGRADRVRDDQDVRHRARSYR